MKRSSLRVKRAFFLQPLLVAAFALLFIAASCGHRGEKPVANDAGSKTTTGTTTVADTVGGSGSGSTIGGPGTGIVKPGADAPGTPRAIVHGSPEQAKLDSIKAAKAKGK